MQRRISLLLLEYEVSSYSINPKERILQISLQLPLQVCSIAAVLALARDAVFVAGGAVVGGRGQIPSALSAHLMVLKIQASE